MSLRYTMLETMKLIYAYILYVDFEITMRL